MKNCLVIFLFIFTMCGNKSSPEEEFEGNFIGSNDGINSSARLTVNDGRLKGTIVMNGKSARIDGSIDGGSARGTLYDAEIDKEYRYTGRISGDELEISIKAPEVKGGVVDLIMQRENNSVKAKPKGKLNADLFGEWRHTEILGGGEMSMTNETLMEFMDDGSFATWPGRSIGPDYSREENKSKAERGTWYTDGKNLYLVDAETGDEGTVNFSVDETRLMLGNPGSGKKIFERIR